MLSNRWTSQTHEQPEQIASSHYIAEASISVVRTAVAVDRGLGSAVFPADAVGPRI